MINNTGMCEDVIITHYRPRTYVRREVMFLQVCICSEGGGVPGPSLRSGGGGPRSQIFGGGSQVPVSDPGGSQILGGVPGLRFWGGVPGLRFFGGVVVPGLSKGKKF